MLGPRLKFNPGPTNQGPLLWSQNTKGWAIMEVAQGMVKCEENLTDPGEAGFLEEAYLGSALEEKGDRISGRTRHTLAVRSLIEFSTVPEAACSQLAQWVVKATGARIKLSCRTH